MATVTITGAGGAIESVTLNTPQTTALAQQIANAINAAAAGGLLNAANLPAGPFTPLPGHVNEAVIPPGAGAGPYTGPTGFQYVVDAETVPVTVTGAANQTVLSGNAGITFNAVGGDTLVSGGGSSAVFVGGSANSITLGDGNSTITGGAGTNNTVSAGAGNVTTFGGSSGNETFLSSGTNVVIEGAGSDTLIAGAGADTIFGNISNTLAFGGSGPMIFVANTGASSIVGGVAGPTLFGSTGSDLTYFGGSGALYVAGGGNETLNAALSTGNNALFAGTGFDSLVAGSGADTLVGGGPNALTDLTGGSGADVFAFFKVNGGPSSIDLISDFTPKDLVLLQGYGPSGVKSVISAGGNTNVVLSDGTTIGFLNVSSLNQNQIIKS